MDCIVNLVKRVLLSFYLEQFFASVLFLFASFSLFISSCPKRK